MPLLPRSRTARRRLMTVAVAAPILALAVGVTIYAMRGSISFFYTPSQAAAAHPPAGRSVQLGGMVRMGSVAKHSDGRVDFVVADRTAYDKVTFQGDLPDLFREGQGIVAVGSFRKDGVFEAKQVLAKHDEKYMPPDLEKALKAQGEWRGDGSTPEYAKAQPTP